MKVWKRNGEERCRYCALMQEDAASWETQPQSLSLEAFSLRPTIRVRGIGVAPTIRSYAS